MRDRIQKSRNEKRNRSNITVEETGLPETTTYPTTTGGENIDTFRSGIIKAAPLSSINSLTWAVSKGKRTKKLIRSNMIPFPDQLQFLNLLEINNNNHKKPERRIHLNPPSTSTPQALINSNRATKKVKIENGLCSNTMGNNSSPQRTRSNESKSDRSGNSLKGIRAYGSNVNKVFTNTKPTLSPNKQSVNNLKRRKQVYSQISPPPLETVDTYPPSNSSASNSKKVQICPFKKIKFIVKGMNENTQHNSPKKSENRSNSPEKDEPSKKETIPKAEQKTKEKNILNSKFFYHTTENQAQLLIENSSHSKIPRIESPEDKTTRKSKRIINLPEAHAQGFSSKLLEKCHQFVILPYPYSLLIPNSHNPQHHNKQSQ
jgi:hypothetical protein